MKSTSFRKMLDIVEFGTDEELDDMEHLAYLMLQLTDLQLYKLIDAYFDRDLAHYDFNNNYKSIVRFGYHNSWICNGDCYTDYRLKKLQKENKPCGK